MITTSSPEPAGVSADGSAPALSAACRVSAVVSGVTVAALLLFYAVELRSGTAPVFGPISDIMTITWDASLIIVLGGFRRTLGTIPAATVLMMATVALTVAGAVGSLLLTVDVWSFELATPLAVVAIFVQSLWLHVLSRRLRGSSWSVGVVGLGRWAPVAQGVGALVVAASLVLGWGSPTQLIVMIIGVALGLPAWAAWPVWFALAAREVDRHGVPDRRIVDHLPFSATLESVRSAPRPVEDSVLSDLKRRLSAFRRVPLVEGVGWGRGTDADYLAELVDYWAESYSWREHEQRFLDYPWVRTEVRGVGLRSIHQTADAEAPTVVLLHGWPDSFLRFERVLPLLTEVNVVVPCLPGYPYADPVTTPGMSASTMAEVVAQSLAALGVERYVVSGGDIGSLVAEALARQHAGRVAALHLTDLPYLHLFSIDPAELGAAEQQYLADGRAWQRREGAYALLQATKPHTLAAGLGDSPAGLAAWIVEKLRSWSDCGGDVESVFPRDDVLTWITAYWVTGTIGSSFLPYVERRELAESRVEVPTVVTIFPKDLVTAPRDFGERLFDIRAWDLEPSGGHFGAWERPDAYVAGLRKAIACA